MLLLAKAALGATATLALTTAYVFHEGTIRVDVDENRNGGSHVHFWVPATAVSGGLRVVPDRYLHQAAERSRPYLPVLRVLAKEMKKYPDTEFLNVSSAQGEHVRISVHGSKIYIDAVDNNDNVHVAVPIDTLLSVADRLEDATPGI